MQSIAIKKLTFTVVFSMLISILHAQNVGIGTATPAASAQLDINSTTKGLLIPRLTSAQRIAIVTPANGLLCYDTNTNSFWYYKNSAWIEITTGTGPWTTTGNNISNNNSGATGIGTSSPDATAKATIQTPDFSTALVIRNPASTAVLQAFVGGPANGNTISLGTPGAMPLALYTNSANRIIINADGNTGIGTETANSKLEVNGSMSMPIRTINAAGSFAITDDDYTVIADCAGIVNNNIAFVLPGASGRKGRIYNITMINNSLLTTPGLSGAVKIYNSDMSIFELLYDGLYSQGQYVDKEHQAKITIQSNGVRWFVISTDYDYLRVPQ